MRFKVYGRPKNKIVRVALRPKADNILLGLGWVMTFHTLIGKTRFGVYGSPKNKIVRALLKLKADNILSGLG